MITICPETEDQHAIFPHYLVTPVTYIMVFKVPQPIYGPTYIICTTCRHWARRTVPRCRCPYNCHQYAKDEMETLKRLRVKHT